MQWLIDMAKEAMQTVLDDYSCFTSRDPGVGPAIQLADLVANNTWLTYDISGFVPTNAKAAMLSVTVASYSSGQIVYLDRVFDNNYHTFLSIKAEEAITTYTRQFLLDLDASKSLRYKISALGLVFCNIEILGSFK